MWLCVGIVLSILFLRATEGQCWVGWAALFVQMSVLLSWYFCKRRRFFQLFSTWLGYVNYVSLLTVRYNAQREWFFCYFFHVVGLKCLFARLLAPLLTRIDIVSRYAKGWAPYVSVLSYEVFKRITCRVYEMLWPVRHIIACFVMK